MKLFLCLVALAATAASAYRFSSGASDLTSEQPWNSLSFGLPHHEYRFNYNVQLNSGFAPWIAEQKAVQRMHAQVRVQFVSEHSAVLRMENVRIGKLNEQLDSTRVQPIQAFETVEIPTEKLEQLEKPVQFTLGDGIVQRVHFDKQEPVWSRNIKKAILSLIQINVRKTDGESTSMSNIFSESSRMFTVEEPSLEGICQTTYTLMKTNENEVNVTKSIDFEQCKRLADSAYGFQGQETQERIAKEMKLLSSKLENIDDEEQKTQQPVPSEKLARSTIYRYQLRRVESGKFALKSAEVVSQYTVRSMKTETGMAMQTLAVGELHLREVLPKKMEKLQQKLGDEESIVYNSRAEAEEKRFYMYGDEEFQKNVFVDEHESEQQLAKSIMSFIQKLAQEFQKNTHETKLELVAQLESTVAKLRKLSQSQIEKLEDKCNGAEKVHLFDLCAIAGTRNTVAVLMKRMPEMTMTKAIQTLKTLSGNLIAPSERIAQLVLKTCEHFDKQSETKESLRQSCWLSFASIVGQVSHQQQRAVYSLEYPTRAEEKQQIEKLAYFARIIAEKMTKSVDKYEQILALKMIGNAGLKQHIELLEKLIRDIEQPTFVRAEAVDALRRMRFTMPEQVQKIVLPIFVDTKQPQQLRMACLSMLVSTLPAGPNDANAIIDQVVYTLLNERSEQVRAFTYSLMKSYSKSPMPVEQQLAKHLLSSLKISNINEEEMLKRASRHIRVPFYSQSEDEGVFVGMNAAFVPQSYLPTHLSAYLDSMLNGFVDKHTIYLSVCQQNADQWLQRIYKQVSNMRLMRGQNSMANEELRKLIQGIKIEKRSESEEEPFAMATLRVKDVDQVVLPVNEKLIQRFVNEYETIIEKLSGEFGINGQTLMAFQEKQIRIPTSTGFGIQMHTIVPMIVDMNARLHLKTQDKFEMKVECSKAHLLVAQQQYMRVNCPLTHRPTGVSSWRAAELQTPKKTFMSIRLTKEQALELKFETVAQETPVCNIRTLPATFVGEKIKSIQNQQLRQQQREIEMNGEKFLITGYVHKPLDFTEPKELLKVLLTAENHINVVFRTNADIKKQIRLRASGAIFRPTLIEEAQPEALNNFFAEHQRIESEESTEESSRRQQHVTKFMQTYAERVNAAGTGNKAYKHWVKLVAETETKKAELHLQAVCDATFTGCRLEMEMERPVFASLEPECSAEHFKLKLNAHTLMPERLAIEESEEEEQKKLSVHNSFITYLNAKWGCSASESHSEKSLKMHLAVRPQPAFPRNVRPFMNQMDMNCEYTLPAHQQYIVKRVYELFKAANFWQSSIVALKSDDSVRRTGTIQARIRVEPVMRQYANLTIQTPTERLQIESMKVPFIHLAPRYLNTVGIQRRASIHSARNLFARIADSTKEECMIQKNGLIQTFDNVHYRAPLSTKCFTVLAKDCKNVGKPAFVVMAKKSEEGSQQKIVKIIVGEQVIVCEPKKNGDEIRVRINGEEMRPYQTPMENIEFDGEELIARLEGITIKYDGERIQVRLSPEYNDAQCGLCGQMNTENDWESLRTAENKPAKSIAHFHQSFAVADDMCTTEVRQRFYKSKEEHFGMIESEEKMSENWPEKSQWESEETMYSNEESKEMNKKTTESKESDEWTQNKEIETEQKIKLVEYKHKICFSMKPINMCPRESYAVEKKEQKVQFGCLDRHSVEARRLLREARQSRNQPLKTLAERFEIEIQPSFVDTITVPQKCQSVY